MSVPDITNLGLRLEYCDFPTRFLRPVDALIQTGETAIAETKPLETTPGQSPYTTDAVMPTKWKVENLLGNVLFLYYNLHLATSLAINTYINIPKLLYHDKIILLLVLINNNNDNIVW